MRRAASCRQLLSRQAAQAGIQGGRLGAARGPEKGQGRRQARCDQGADARHRRRSRPRGRPRTAFRSPACPGATAAGDWPSSTWPPAGCGRPRGRPGNPETSRTSCSASRPRRSSSRKGTGRRSRRWRDSAARSRLCGAGRGLGLRPSPGPRACFSNISRSTSLAGFGLEDKDLAVSAAGALLYYLKKIRKDSLGLVQADLLCPCRPADDPGRRDDQEPGARPQPPGRPDQGFAPRCHRLDGHRRRAAVCSSPGCSSRWSMRRPSTAGWTPSRSGCGRTVERREVSGRASRASSTWSA